MADSYDIRDDHGVRIEVGKFTLNGGEIVAIGDVDLNASGTGTEIPITVRYGDEIEVYAAHPSYTLPEGCFRCSRVVMS